MAGKSHMSFGMIIFDRMFLSVFCQMVLCMLFLPNWDDYVDIFSSWDKKLLKICRELYWGLGRVKQIFYCHGLGKFPVEKFSILISNSRFTRNWIANISGRNCRKRDRLLGFCDWKQFRRKGQNCIIFQVLNNSSTNLTLKADCKNNLVWLLLVLFKTCFL